MNVLAGMGMPWQGGPLATLADKRMPAHGITAPVSLADAWPAAFFGLDAVRAYQHASEDVQRAIRADCARGTLMEAYFIEKAGISYAAKMVLLAQTAEERTLYALFCAEEAAHLDAVRAALGPVDEDSWQANPFLTLLQAIIEQGDRETGQLVIQVVLEGWGIQHYTALRDACADRPLRDVLARIVADEAGHHGSGVALLKGCQMPRPDEAADLLAQMLRMVQLGPAQVVGAIERGLDGLTQRQRLEVYTQLDTRQHIRTRLDRLQRCMAKVPAARPILQNLRDRGGFTVPQVQEVA